MRILFPLILLLGAAVAFGYQHVAARVLPAEQVGLWRVYDASGGFRGTEANLGPAGGPFRVTLDLSLPAPEVPPAGFPLTVTISRGGQTVLAEPVSFTDAAIVDDNPQTPERSFRAQVGTVPAGEPGPLVVTVAEGDAPLPPSAVADLQLTSGGTRFDGRAEPVGYALIALGFIGTVLAWSRRRQPAGEAAAPAAPERRWGRGASDGS